MDAIDLGLKRIERRQKYEKLVDEILETSLNPMDKYEVAAIIESLGWNDRRVLKTFGVENVFELSENLWQSIQERVASSPLLPAKGKSFAANAGETIRSFLRGIIFALPMAISVVSMLTLRFSLWSSLYLSTDLATAIAIGTILSFMAVGGYTQAIARRGFFYIKQGFFNMCKRITFYFVRMGFISFVILSILFILFNLFFEQLSYSMMIVAILYFLFLSINWISVTVMYILEKELTFTGLIAAGIGAVFILFEIFKLDIIVSQLIAMLFISVSGFILVMYFFRASERKLEKGIAPKLPQKSIMLYSIMPFFNYGFLYFTFLFCDRVIAWSRTGDYMPYFIWFRGEYELGLDFALLMLVIPMGLSEVIVNKFMSKVEETQRNDLYGEFGTLSSNYMKLYIKSMMLLSIVSIVSGVLIYIAVMAISGGYVPSLGIQFTISTTTHYVLIVAICAYGILSIGLSNSMVLFSLSQPKLVTKPVALCLLVNVIVGFVLSRWFDYYYAVYGLLAGSILFLFLTSRSVIKVMSNLDYYMYAAT